MLDAVWAGASSESTLATRINAARGAIGDDGESQRLIRTLSRRVFALSARCGWRKTKPHAACGPSPSAATARVGPWVGAERRQLTIMSCDFAGVRELATRLDPEDKNDALNDVCSASNTSNSFPVTVTSLLLVCIICQMCVNRQEKPRAT